MRSLHGLLPMTGRSAPDDDEIERMTSFLGHSENEFVERYTRLTANRSGLTLSDKANGECIFPSGIDCRIQPVKPKQCRAFPNLWNFPGFERICRARPIDLGAAEYEQRIAALQS